FDRDRDLRRPAPRRREGDLLERGLNAGNGFLGLLVDAGDADRLRLAVGADVERRLHRAGAGARAAGRERALGLAERAAEAIGAPRDGGPLVAARIEGEAL